MEKKPAKKEKSETEETEEQKVSRSTEIKNEEENFKRHKTQPKIELGMYLHFNQK